MKPTLRHLVFKAYTVVKELTEMRMYYLVGWFLIVLGFYVIYWITMGVIALTT
ncbi:hypothetical protein [uncultured Psychroserpens sp.]|uniref:hypothetical protein n=1 Tax=uncultured Psychroserpens sp. TaxID=255436 RepID=UPI00260663FC|nr:hypothetical protein [uncultured Psychroserpens sp.]